MLHPARSPIIKPPRGTPINRAHPLSRGLVCAIPMSENAGNSVWDYVGNCGRGSLDGSAVWDSRGVYTSETDDTGHIDVALPSWLRSRLQDAVSITCTYTRVGAVLYSHLFAAGSGNLEWACYLGSDGKIRVSIDGSEHAATATGVADGETAFVGWGFDRTAGIAHAQRDAEVIRNTGLTINQPTVDSGLVLLNRSFNSQTRDADGIMHWFLMWDRLLSVEEFATVWREPFAVYNRSARSRYFNVAGGTAVDCSLGQIAVTGQEAGISAGTTIACATGQATIASYQADVETPGATIDCTLGTVAIAGLPAGISASKNIDCSLGQVAIEAYIAQIEQGIIIECTTGAIIIGGPAADISAGKTINCTLPGLDMTGYRSTVVSSETAVGAVDISISAAKPGVSVSAKKPTVTIS